MKNVETVSQARNISDEGEYFFNEKELDGFTEMLEGVKKWKEEGEATQAARKNYEVSVLLSPQSRFSCTDSNQGIQRLNRTSVKPVQGLQFLISRGSRAYSLLNKPRLTMVLGQTINRGSRKLRLNGFPAEK